MTALLLKKWGKTLESSWHERWNLKYRTVIGRNEMRPFQKEGRHGDKKSECIWGRAYSPIHLEGEIEASAWGTNSWHTYWCSHDGTEVRLLQRAFYAAELTSGNQKVRSLRMPSVDYSWQMSVTETKIINIWLLPVFSIHLQSQEKSEFSVSFLLLIHLPRRALPFLFSWFSQSRIENRPQKLQNKRGRRRLVLLLLEWNARQQPSKKRKKEKRKQYTSWKQLAFFFKNFKTKLENQNQKFKKRSLQGVAQHHCN